MSRILKTLAAATTLLLPFAAPAEVRFGAWITYWELDRGMATVLANQPLFGDVYLFLWHLDGQGRPIAAMPQAELDNALRQLRGTGANLWLTVVNDVVDPSLGKPRLKDAAITAQVLGDDERRRDHIRDLVQLARIHGAHGIDIDYENLPAKLRDPFSVFVEELAARTQELNLQLAVTVQPKRGESPSPGPAGADWARLCRSADRLQIMLYNEHSEKSPPGPMASPAWIARILGYAETQCPRDRIVPALKVSGAQWGPQAIRYIEYDTAVGLAAAHGAEIRRDPEHRVPYFQFAGEGGPQQVYYEDADSVLAKAAPLASRGYSRMMLWSLGRQDPRLPGKLAPLTGGNGSR